MSSRRYNAVIIRTSAWYVARCLEIPVTTQGRTIEEAQSNLREAVELYVVSIPTDELPEISGEVLLYTIEISLGT